MTTIYLKTLDVIAPLLASLPYLLQRSKGVPTPLGVIRVRVKNKLNPMFASTTGNNEFL